MNNINLIYAGGSGGFLLLHLLLLSGCYAVALKNNHSIETAISQQWKINNSAKWKESEFWPDNSQTQLLETDLHKIYFYCNSELTSIVRPGKLAVIYTDYASQQNLAYYKKAHWYKDKTKPAFDFKFSAYIKLLRTWREHYNNIKDAGWPKCVSFRHIDRLPHNIQQEILNNPNTKYFLNYQYTGESIVDTNGVGVYQQSAEYVKSAHIAIKLQDVVNSNGEILVDAFDIPPINTQQQQLIAHWRGLHPPALLDRIGIAN